MFNARRSTLVTGRPSTQPLRGLGYGGDRDLVEAEMQKANLSNPWMTLIPAAKVEGVRRLIEERFLLVCGRGECQEVAREVVRAARGGRRPPGA